MLVLDVPQAARRVSVVPETIRFHEVPSYLTMVPLMPTA